MTETAPSFPRSTILLLVSDPVVRAVLQETLEVAGYTVLSTSDLGQAVDRLKRCTPDLLLTRTYVQNLTGHDAAIYLRSKCLKMRVLIVGGLLDDDRLKNRETLQGFEVYPTPYPATELLKKVAEVLSKPR
jgi:CheY-like chemotaxis protein